MDAEINPEEIITLRALSGEDAWMEFRFPEIDHFLPMMLVVKLNVKLSEVRRNELDWQVARADFKFYDQNREELRKYRYSIMSGVGSHDWKSYVRSFPIPGSAWGGLLFLHNAGSAGIVSFSGLAVFPAAARRSFLLGKWFMLGLWVTGLLFYLNKLRKWWLERRSRILPVLFVFLLLLLFLAAILVSENAMEAAWTKLVWLPDREMVKGWGHFLIFFILTLLSLKKFADRKYAAENAEVLPPSGRELLIVTLYLLLFAWASEVLQFFSSSRFPSFSDWLDDAAGVLLGLMIYVVASRLNAKIENRNKLKGSDAPHR